MMAGRGGEDTMLEVIRNLNGKLMPPANRGGMKGAYNLIELDEPYEGIRYGVMDTETRGRDKVRQRLGRLFETGDAITICRFKIGAEALLVLEVE
jgi:hypothetical protein